MDCTACKDLDFDAAVNASVAATEPRSPRNGFPYTVIPEGMEFRDLTDQLPEKAQRLIRGEVLKQTVTVGEVDSFCRYVDKFKRTGTVLFGDRDHAKVTARLDYHPDPTEVGDDEHSVTLQLKHSRQWKAWTGINRRAIPQAAFGEFLEDNLPDIVQPEAARVLESARNLVVHKKVTFTGKHGVADGSINIGYSEEVAQSRTAGKLEIPEKLMLAIPIYEHGAPIPLAVRLRYKVSENDLHFTVIIDQAEQALEAAFAAILAQIDAETGFTPFLGNAN